MVLQRGARAALFGFTVPGDTVTCSLRPEGGVSKAREALCSLSRTCACALHILFDPKGRGSGGADTLLH